jgi:hypothetical protein
VILDQKLIVLYLAGKRMNSTPKYQDLFTTLGVDAVPYPTVTHVLRKTLFPDEQLPAQELDVDPKPSAIDLAVTMHSAMNHLLQFVNWSRGYVFGKAK